MITCKNCGNIFDEKYDVCPKCGTPITQQYTYNMPAQMSSSQNDTVIKKKINTKLITIISVSAVVLVGIVIVLIMLFSQPNTEAQIDEQISLGEKYLTEENYEEAIVAFKKAIEIEPNDPDLYIKLADAYLGKGDTDNAIETLENGYKQTDSDEIKKKLDKLKSDIQYKKFMSSGETALSNKKYDEAINDFNNAIKLKPSESKPYISISDAYIGNNDNDSAKKILEQGYEKTKSDEIKKKLDILENNIKAENLIKYKKIYQEYIDSEQWRTYEDSNGNGTITNNDRLILSDTEIFDFDGDGIPEMLLYTSNPNSTVREESHTLFCTIKNDKVETVLSANTSGGTMGGNYIRIKYDNEENDFVVGLSGSAGGFGGNAYFGEWYKYSSGSLSKIIDYSSTEFFNQFTVPNEYKVNDKNVDKKTLSFAEYRFSNVDYESLPLLFDSPDREAKLEEQENPSILHSDRIQKYNGQVYYTTGKDIGSQFAENYDFSYLGYKTLPNDKSILDFIIYNDYIYYIVAEIAESGSDLKYNLMSCDLSGENIKTISEDVNDDFAIKDNNLQFAVDGDEYRIIHKNYNIETGEITFVNNSDIIYSKASKLYEGKIFDDGYYYYVYPTVDNYGVSTSDKRTYRRDNKTGEVKEVGKVYYQHQRYNFNII